VEHLVYEPHHDGSILYRNQDKAVPDGAVTVRVRTHTAAPVDALWVRTVEDGAPRFRPCRIERRERETVWWTGLVHGGPAGRHYRFLLVADGAVRWLNQAGVHDREVGDAHDFRIAPAGTDRAAGVPEGVVYQIFPDRFARSSAADQRPIPDWAVPAQWDEPPVSAGPHAPLQFYGGDLDGIVDRLRHLSTLGVELLALTPIFTAESNHREDPSTFDEVDPLLGGDEALRRLLDAAHARGLRVIGELSLTHTGADHAWYVAATARKRSKEHGLYRFDESGTVVGWQGHPDRPALAPASKELAFRMRGVAERWLAFGLDGWRLHGAGAATEPLAREFREATIEARPDALLVAGTGHDQVAATEEVWDARIDDGGFTLPVWEWLRDPDRSTPAGVLPVGVPRRDGQQVVASMREAGAAAGWHRTTRRWNALGTARSARVRTITGSAGRHRLAAVLQFTLPGVPMVFAGDEVGVEGADPVDARRPMPWGGATDQQTHRVYADLARLRREHVALRAGGLRWVRIGTDDIAYLREHPAETLLIRLARTGDAAPELPGLVRTERLFAVGDAEQGARAEVWRVVP
jgi:alpha-glucosidase